MPPTPVLLATCLGITLSTTFTIGSLGLSYLAIPAILLPSTAPLMPPLELVTKAHKREYNTNVAPKQPLDSGVGNEDESILDTGATSRKLRKDGNKSSGSPSSTSYLLRQWFHLFSKGMHTFPPFAISSAVCYLFCAVMLPGPLSTGGSVAVNRAAYVLATVLSVGIMAFTLTILEPVNSALHERVKQVITQEREGDDSNVDDKREETERLIRKWGEMNAKRSVLPVLAISCAVFGLVL